MNSGFSSLKSDNNLSIYVLDKEGIHRWGDPSILNVGLKTILLEFVWPYN